MNMEDNSTNKALHYTFFQLTTLKSFMKIYYKYNMEGQSGTGLKNSGQAN